MLRNNPRLKPSSPPAIALGLVEHDRACREALVAAIATSKDVHLVWQAASLAEALPQLTMPIDVLLVDLGLPDGSGLDLIRAIREVQPDCAVMVSTMFADEDNLLGAVQAGALGYLLKDVSTAEVLGEIRILHSGGSPINPKMARKLLYSGFPAKKGEESAAPPENLAQAVPTAFQLSPRETQVLQLVARGHILDEVATTMGITRHTARSFVRRIYRKLQVSNRAEAVHLAIRKGLL